MSWHGLVDQQQAKRVLFAHAPCRDCLMLPYYWEKLISQAVKQLERPVDRFGDPMNVQQPKAAMERHRRKVILFEDIRKGPEAVSIHQAVNAHYDPGGVGCGGWQVVHIMAWVGGDVPFRIVKRLASDRKSTRLNSSHLVIS